MCVILFFSFLAQKGQGRKKEKSKKKKSKREREREREREKNENEFLISDQVVIVQVVFFEVPMAL